MHALGTEMEKVGLAAVRGILMDADTTDEVEAACKHWPPRAMSVRRRWAGSDAASVLQDNDLLLEIDGQLVETFRDIEMQVLGKPEVSLLVVRRGKKLTLKVKTIPLIESVTERVILWCGALLQAPPIAIAAQRGQEQCGVYVSSRFHGSPAATYNLPPMARIVEVDGQPTPDVDALLRVVGELGFISWKSLRFDTFLWASQCK
jgi:S1-C subfamily serine protease